MDTAGFYHQGSSVTHSLAESPFRTPPSTHPGHRHPSQYGQQFVGHPELTSVNQKLDRVLAVVLEQKEAVAKQQKEIACNKEQLCTVVSEIEQIKDVSSSASETKAAKQAIPCEISLTIRNIHDHLPIEKQFNKAQSYRSENNVKVRKQLGDELKHIC